MRFSFLLLGLLVAGFALAEVAEIDPFGDAHADLLAVSLTGDSTAPYGVAVTGTGRAVGGTAVSALGDAEGPVPLAPLGTCDGRRCFDVQPFGDAEGYWLAASATGNATACEPGLLCKGTAVSVLGDAEGMVAVTLAGDARGGLLQAGLGTPLCSAFACVFPGAEGPTRVCAVYCAAAGSGDVEGDLVGVSLFGTARGEVAASAFGDSEARRLALSGTGDASGRTPLSVAGTCEGRACFAVGTGDATGYWTSVSLGASRGGLLAASVGGSAEGFVAASVAGPATTCGSGSCTAVSVFGDSTGGDAGAGTVSAFGDARSSFAISGTGHAKGALVAISGTGRAEGPVALSGCDVGLCWEGVQQGPRAAA